MALPPKRNTRGRGATGKVKPEEVKPEEVKPEEAKPEEVKPEEAKPEEAKPEEAKPQKGNTGINLGKILPTPVDVLLKEGKNESERARILLVTISRQLFTALLTTIILGAIIATSIHYLNNIPSATLPVVMLCGIVGGFVSIQRRLKELTMQDLILLAESRIYLILAPFVGGILAMVLYVIFLSGLLQGDLFPEFMADTSAAKGGGGAVPAVGDGGAVPAVGDGGAVSKAGGAQANGFMSIFHQHGKDYSDYAKLMFWCFVAGFSERFVTDIIGKFEGNAVKTIK